MELRMAVALTSPSSLSEWASLAKNVAAAPPLHQVLGSGAEYIGGVTTLPHGPQALLASDPGVRETGTGQTA
jgi:hypothetical protein